MTQIINVAAAVIIDSQSRTLLSLRHIDSHQGGKWEFPGGKIEQNESIERALIRELKEELGIEVKRTQPFIELQYEYPEKSVNLSVLKVLEFIGEPRGLEGQRVEWVAINKSSELEFPDANYPILKKLIKLLK